jgi:hypothetical protein
MYDPRETLQWMIDEAAAEVRTETAPDAGGRHRRKARARREAELARLSTLCEVAWNMDGRPVPFEEMVARVTA